MAWGHSTRTNGQNIDASHVNVLAADIQTWGGNVNAATYKLINLADPTSAQEAATKAYVDAATGGGALSSAVESFTGSTSSTITVANTPDVATHPFRLYKNGMYLLVGTDYTRSGTTVTLSHARTTDDTFVADYYHA